jgi:hypothetical protein
MDKQPWNGAVEPFATLGELVDAECELVCARARSLLAARAQRRVASGAQSVAREVADVWPPELRDAEQYIEARAAASAAAGLDFPIAWLRTRLRLTPDEMRVLWVLIAHERSDEARDLLRKLNTETTTDPTTATLQLVAFGTRPPEAASEIWKPDRLLVGNGLVERTDNDPSAAPYRRTWKAAPRVLALAYGDTSTDDALAEIGEVVTPGRLAIGIGGAGIEAAPEALDKLTNKLKEREHAPGPVIVQGPRGIGRRSLLRLASARLGLELLEFDLDQLAKEPAVARQQIAALGRDCRLFHRVPLLRNLDALVHTQQVGSDDVQARTVLSAHVPFLARTLRGLLVLGTTTASIPRALFAAPSVLELRGITGEQRERLFRRALPMLPEATASKLATTFPVSPSVLAAAAPRAIEEIGDGSDTERAVRRGLQGALDQLSGLATLLDTDKPQGELVVPREVTKQLTEMIARITHQRTVYEEWKWAERSDRGLGVSALFYGPPGTGKTMAAGIVARAISANLYIVDMSRIMSKWIGETEKNLGQLFDAADASHAALLFDEADALFGKRTEVKTSNDRFANAETNYLLTRLERFRGVCILTTNNDTAVDEAFKRRIAFHVEFPMPDDKERAELWRSMLIASIPTKGAIDFAALARRFEMSGGYIAKAMVRAMFMAAHAGTPVTHALLEIAAADEYHYSMGRITSSLSSLSSL